MEGDIAEVLRRDTILAWAQHGADKAEHWAGIYRAEDKEMCMLLNRVCDALCDLIDEIGAGEGNGK